MNIKKKVPKNIKKKAGINLILYGLTRDTEIIIMKK
jgi:hypothetical protein